MLGLFTVFHDVKRLTGTTASTMSQHANTGDMRLSDISQLKKRLTFGNIPPGFHAVATSIGMAEGMFRYGFEDHLDKLLDKSNWNLTKLGGTQTPMGEIECPVQPRLSVYTLFTPDGFEVHCIPWNKDQEFDYELANRPDMDFKYWNPATMKVVFRIAQLHNFIRMYFEHGDEADLALIRYAHNVAEAFVEDLQSKLNVQKVFGVSVRSFFEFAQKRRAAGEDIYLPKVYQFDH